MPTANGSPTTGAAQQYSIYVDELTNQLYTVDPATGTFVWIIDPATGQPMQATAQIANIPNQLALPETKAVLDTLEQAGFEAWFVGGCVRDAILGRTMGDIDITTNAPWQHVQKICTAAGMAVHETGVKHGTVTVVCHNMPFEVTTFRTDGTYSDARHPDSVEFVQNIEDDLARRDFTINAMAFHPARGLCDPFGGQADLQARLIRAVGDASARFQEDALRILRAVRFASQLGFSIEKDTKAALFAQAEGLGHIAVERIRAELEGMLCGAHPHDAIMSCGPVLDVVLPELAPMRNFDQLSRYHIYDVMEHTAFVVEYVQPATPLLRWAALFHDCGKPNKFFTDAQGNGHFYGHEAESVIIAEPVLKRLKLSPSLIEDVLQLVRFHDTYCAPEPHPVKRMIRKLGGNTELMRALCHLKRADAQAHAPEYRQGIAAADKLEDSLDAVIADSSVLRVKDLAIGGHDVLACGIKPGPRVGEVLETALEAVIDERVPNERDALLRFLGL